MAVIVVAILAADVFYGLSELDGHVLSPPITRRVVQVSPFLIIVGLTLGPVLYGAIGALIAVPVVAAVQVIVREILIPWLHSRQGISKNEGNELQGDNTHTQ